MESVVSSTTHKKNLLFSQYDDYWEPLIHRKERSQIEICNIEINSCKKGAQREGLTGSYISSKKALDKIEQKAQPPPPIMDRDSPVLKSHMVIFDPNVMIKKNMAMIKQQKVKQRKNLRRSYNFKDERVGQLVSPLKQVNPVTTPPEQRDTTQIE